MKRCKSFAVTKQTKHLLHIRFIQQWRTKRAKIFQFPPVETCRANVDEWSPFMAFSSLNLNQVHYLMIPLISAAYTTLYKQFFWALVCNLTDVKAQLMTNDWVLNFGHKGFPYIRRSPLFRLLLVNSWKAWMLRRAIFFLFFRLSITRDALRIANYEATPQSTYFTAISFCQSAPICPFSNPGTLLFTNLFSASSSLSQLHQTSTTAPARSHAAIQVNLINSSFNGAQCGR